MSTRAGEGVPFRWDLVTPDQLGSLLAGTTPPRLGFLDDLVSCAGKVVARSQDGDLFFVGRSLDSMFDLLGGAFAAAGIGVAVHRLPLSFARPAVQAGRRWRHRALTPGELAQVRRVLAGMGLSPYALARRTRPVVFVDVVHSGSTFTDLFELLRRWIKDEGESWPVIRRKLRFVGVTSRTKTSPKAYRWRQDNPWTNALPRSGVTNVSLDPLVWSYFGDWQIKLTRSHRPEHWLADVDGPSRDEKTRQALAEAVALVHYGRSIEGRRALARAMDGEPALVHAWLRNVVTRLNRP